MLILLVIVPILIVGAAGAALSRATQDRIADTSSLVDETLNAIQTWQAFTSRNCRAAATRLQSNPLS